MRDEIKAQREENAQRFYNQVRVYADKHGKKMTMAYMATKERFPEVFIPPEWQNRPTPKVDLDPVIEQELLDKAKAFAQRKAAKKESPYAS